jgi:acyl carrier protein
MTRDEAFAAYQTVAADLLAVDASAVVPEASFADDLNADSLTLVEFVMALEERFDVTIEEEELAGVSTVGGSFELLCTKLGI